jgi:hypothetical protein
MDIPGPMMNIEDLAGLGYRAEQRVVAALALLAAVESNSGPFGPPAGAEDRAIEVEGDSPQTERRQTIQNKLPTESAQLRDTVLANRRQQAADRGHVGQSRQAEYSVDHGVVAIVTEISQLPKPGQEVDDERQDEMSVVVRPRGSQMPEALLQAPLQRQTLEEQLEEEQPGKGGELLTLETQFREGVDLATDLGSAKLHGKRFPWIAMVVLTTPFYQSWSRFSLFNASNSEVTGGGIQPTGSGPRNTQYLRPPGASEWLSQCN